MPRECGEELPNKTDGMEKPKCQLVGTDGNVFAIIGSVSKALKRAGLSDQAKAFTDAAFAAGSYDEVLQLCFKYVEVE